MSRRAPIAQLVAYSRTARTRSKTSQGGAAEVAPTETGTIVQSWIPVKLAEQLKAQAHDEHQSLEALNRADVAEQETADG